MSDLHERVRAHLTATFHFTHDQIEQMLPSFFDTLRGHMAAVERAIDENTGQLARTAHTLKGALFNLGLEAEADIAMELEKRGMDGDFDTASLMVLSKRLREKLAGL